MGRIWIEGIVDDELPPGAVIPECLIVQLPYVGEQDVAGALGRPPVKGVFDDEFVLRCDAYALEDQLFSAYAPDCQGCPQKRPER